MTTAVHQFVQSFVDHDAISSHVRNLRKLIQGMGLRSEVYAGEWRGEASKAKFFREYDTSDDAVVLYHLAIASSMADYLQTNPVRLAINYHNITPYSFMAPWEPLVAPELEVARRQLAALAPRAECGIGVSHYNTSELADAGCKNTATAPILLNGDEFDMRVDRQTSTALQSAKSAGGSDWLFVGRVTPHKCQHEIISAFAVYRRLYDHHARLHLIGGLSSHRYWTSLRQYIDMLNLGDCVEIKLGVSNEVLGAHYKNADVFVCLSEHEGFGVPVLEAMYNDVPVVAFDSSAVGETVGDAAIVLDSKPPARVAAAAHRILSDESLRSHLVKAGHDRVEHFSRERSEASWRDVLAKLAGQS